MIGWHALTYRCSAVVGTLPTEGHFGNVLELVLPGTMGGAMSTPDL